MFYILKFSGEPLFSSLPDVQYARGYLLLLTKAGALYAVRLYALEKQAKVSLDAAAQTILLAERVSSFAIDQFTATVYYFSNGEVMNFFEFNFASICGQVINISNLLNILRK